jgi:uncharacterized tellurite resistance protein B-like protein
MPLFDDILARLLQPPTAPPDTVGAPFQRRELAVVALLIELAQSDRNLNAEELATIERIARERFGLDAATAGRLIAAARSEFDASLEDWVFAKAVRDGFGTRERVEIVELLWEVVYADGQLARLEESSMRRLAAQLRIGEAEREAARAQAFARAYRPGSRDVDPADAE